MLNFFEFREVPTQSIAFDTINLYLSIHFGDCLAKLEFERQE